MSTLKELLKDIPVDWKTFGDYIDYVQPTKYLVNSKNYNDDYKTPVLTAGKTFILGYSDEKNGIFPASKTPVIIFDDFTTANKWVDFDFKAKSSAMKILMPKDDTNIVLKYFYYWLSSLSSELADGDHKRQWISNFSLKLFPIPYPNDPQKSLTIQQEIVRVLDDLSEQNKTLTSALTQEIEQRKKQYEYYREALFHLKGKEFDIKLLGDENIGKFTRGSGLQKKDFTESGVGCIHYGQVYTYYNTYAYETKSFVSVEFAKNARKAKTGDLVIATTSENDEDVCKAVTWLGEKDIAVSSDACFYSHKLNPKYVAYYFQTEQFQKQKRRYITGTKVRRVNVNDLEKITIPISILIEQERIVSLLDQFNETTINIVASLENEIDLRNKQYEYYRNLLLNFPKI
jgi:type I restriction enzyme S subunit